MKLIPYSRQNISKEDINAVISTLNSDFLTQGPKIVEFEEALAKFCKAKYAAVLNSGTAALHASYFALGLSKGDEFIVPSMTFAATSNAGLYLGAKPIFIDVEKDTGNIDVSKIEEKITKKTKLISPVHFGGLPADLLKIRKIAKKHKLFVVEDASHALGATYKDSKIGDSNYSDTTVFSFHPVKHITTGEGGAVLTNNKKLYEKVMLFRSHGITKKEFKNKADGDWYYEMQELGFNYRITDLQAALGLSQMKKASQFVKRRQEIALIYKKRFKENPFFKMQSEKDYGKSAYHLYPILLNDKYIKFKSKIFKELRDNKLWVQVHYIPVYLHPYYRNLGYKKGLSPNAEDFYRREISIPIYPGMTNEDVNYVIKTLFNVLEKF